MQTQLHRGLAQPPTWASSFLLPVCPETSPSQHELLCLFALFPREDEHALIQQYCQTLGGESPVSQPQSPAQILKSVEREERGELERIIADLEEEQRFARPRRRKRVTLSFICMSAVPFSFQNDCLRCRSEVKVLEDIDTLGWGWQIWQCLTLMMSVTILA